jgi:hypothetical protein
MSYAVIVCGLSVGEEILLVEPRDVAGTNPT